MPHTRYLMPLKMHIDVFTSGIACLAVCVMGCLIKLHFREKLQPRKAEEQRRRQRLAHWGYE